MTNEMLEQYIRNYMPKNKRRFQICEIDGYDFTFMVDDQRTIGGVLDMGSQPHICVLPEYRRQGYGVYLLERYLIENDLIGGNKYVFYDAGTEDGLALIKYFKNREPNTYKVIEVGYRKYIIIQDSRI